MNDLAKKLLLAAAALCLSGVGAELWLRAFVGEPQRENITPVPSAITMPSTVADLPYLLKPGSRAEHAFPSNPRGYFDESDQSDEAATVTYTINSLGFRGPETSLAKPPETFRIVGIGDSFTFGTGARVEDTFLADLERRLAARDSSVAFEVLNLGMMGLDTVREVTLLREVGIGYEPDIVVICFFLNDARGMSTNDFFNPVPEWDGALRRSSFLLDRISWLLERRRQSEELYAKLRRSFRPKSRAWIRAQAALESAAELAERERFQLVLMIFPVLWNLSDDYPFSEIHQTVKSFSSSKGIETLDLLPEFSAYRGPELWVHPTNQHPNEIAHAIAGRALFNFLRTREMLPPIQARVGAR